MTNNKTDRQIANELRSEFESMVRYNQDWVDRVNNGMSIEQRLHELEQTLSNLMGGYGDLMNIVADILDERPRGL